MDGVLVGEGGIEGGEQVFILLVRDSKSNIEYEDSYSALFLQDDLLRLLADCLEVVDDLSLCAVDDELHVGDGKSFGVHHQLLGYLAEVSC